VRRWKPWRDTRPVCGGMDTETFHGELKLLTAPDAFYEPTGNGEEMLSWMLDHGAEVTWFFNLKFDAGVLIRSLGVDLEAEGPARELFKAEHKVTLGRYTVSLIGAKSFRVEFRGEAKEEGEAALPSRRIDCFDAAAFFTRDEHRVTLDEAALTFLGEGKNNTELGIDRKKIGTVQGYYEAHREAIIAYGMKDAELTKRLGEYLVDATGEALGFWPTRWSSAASLSKAWLAKYHPEIAARSKADFGVFRRSFRGALFVTRTLGRVPNQDELDLRQAYTRAILTLPSLEGLTYRIGNGRSSDAVYGCYMIEVPYDGKLGFRLSDLTGENWDRKNLPYGEPIFYPNSTGEMKPYWATLVELAYFDEERIPYRIVTSYELCGVPKGTALDDIRPLADRVIALKELAKKDPKASTMRETFKRVVNATFGSLAESRHGTTPFTTWPMAAFITATCRVAVWRQWRRVEEGRGEVVSVNADSIRYVKGEYEIPTGPEIGDFSVKFAGATVTHYGSGRALIEHRPDCACGDCKGAPKLLPSEQFYPELHQAVCQCRRCAKAPRVTLRKRGFPSLSVSDLLTARGYEVEVVLKRPLTIMEGVIQRRMNEVGDIPDTEETIAEDDGARRRRFSLLSNMNSAFYDPRDLTFPKLNAGPVVGVPMPYEAVFEQRWVREALGMRRVVEAGGLE
jgi:hypothetical protein